MIRPYLTGICEELERAYVMGRVSSCECRPDPPLPAPTTSCKVKADALQRACITYSDQNATPSKCMFIHLNACLIVCFFP